MIYTFFIAKYLIYELHGTGFGVSGGVYNSLYKDGLMDAWGL